LVTDCNGDKLDLLTLSHFHNDHINGVVELLNKVGAKTVMLPWAHLWHRLLIGFDQGLQADDPEMVFYIDPVAYLNGAAPERFERVLFVMPSDGEGPPFMIEPAVSTEGPRDRGLDVEPGESATADELELSPSNAMRQVKKLRRGDFVSVNGVWEFVPYNDPSTRPNDPLGFAAIVGIHRAALLNGNTEERKGVLKQLRDHYETIFGHAAMNDVSLMLYGGAVGPWRGQRFCDCESHFHRLLSFCGCWKELETKGAILLTGDGNLSSPAKWTDLENYLNVNRAKRTIVFQVAHHGARTNWHLGLAALATPMTSVFSSDTHHNYGHPHAEVLRDFWPFRPIQVDQHSGLLIHIVLEQ
jgi:hypothetical protein